MQGEVTRTALPGPGADEFGTRPLEGGSHIEQFLLESPASAEFVRQRSVQSIQCRDALEDARLDPTRFVAHGRRSH